MNPGWAYLSHKVRSLQRVSKRLEYLPTIQIALGLSLGIILFSWQAMAGFTASLCVLLIGRRKFTLFVAALLLGGVHFAVFYAGGAESAKHFGETISTVATVIANPQLTDYNQRVVLRLDSYNGDILANMPKYPQLQQGSRVAVKLQLKGIAEAADGSYLVYLQSAGIRYAASISNFVVIENRSVLDVARQGLAYSVRQQLGEPQAGLLIGMLIGESGSFDKDLELALRASGTSHIVSVSGFNVSVVLLMVLVLAGRINRRTLLLTIPILLGAYLCLVGWGNLPAKRAVFMCIAMFLPLAIGRRAGIYFGICYAVAMMLIENPLVWQNISFQLSLAALLGMLLLANTLQGVLRRLPGFISSGLATTVAALIATIPITAVSFGEMSVVATLANLLVLPAVPVAMYLGILAICLSWVPVIGQACFWLANLALTYVIEVVRAFGSLPIASTQDPVLIFISYMLLVSFWLIADYVQFSHQGYKPKF